MEQTAGIAALVGGVVGTGDVAGAVLLLYDAAVVGIGIRVVACVEVAVADAVERVGIGAVRAIGLLHILRKLLTRRGVFLLGKEGIGLQVERGQTVGRTLIVRLLAKSLQVAQAGIEVAQTVGRFGTPVEGLGHVVLRLGLMVDHLGHLGTRTGYITLQEEVDTHLVTQVLLGLAYLVGLLRVAVQYLKGFLAVVGLHIGLALQAVDMLGILAVRIVLQESVEGCHYVTQRRVGLVHSQGVVVSRLFGHPGRDAYLASCLVVEFGGLDIMQVDIDISERHEGALGDGVLLGLYFFEVLDGLLGLVGLVVGHTQQVHVVALQLQRLLGLVLAELVARVDGVDPALVALQVVLGLVVLAALVVYLAQHTVQFGVVLVVGIGLQQGVGTGEHLVVVLACIVDLHDIVGDRLAATGLFLHLAEERHSLVVVALAVVAIGGIVGSLDLVGVLLVLEVQERAELLLGLGILLAHHVAIAQVVEVVLVVRTGEERGFLYLLQLLERLAQVVLLGLLHLDDGIHELHLVQVGAIGISFLIVAQIDRQVLVVFHTLVIALTQP